MSGSFRGSLICLHIGDDERYKADMDIYDAFGMLYYSCCGFLDEVYKSFKFSCGVSLLSITALTIISIGTNVKCSMMKPGSKGRV